MDGFWIWLVASDAGLLLRIVLGATFFAALAVWEIRRKGRDARRWREYVFLLSAVAAAMAYGVINDQVTVGISWEYFHYAKGGIEVLGEGQPSMAALRWHAVGVGLKATWTAGLIFGVMVLLANNPRRQVPQLPYCRLYALLPVVMLLSAGVAAIGGLAGWLGAFAGGFKTLLEGDIWRPGRFMAVWGIHLGGYVGGAAGAIAAVAHILIARRKLARSIASASGGGSAGPPRPPAVTGRPARGPADASAGGRRG